MTFPSRDALDERALAEIAPARNSVGPADRIWTGPDAMTRRTAELMSHDALVEEALAELDFGAWRGRSLQDVAVSDPLGLKAWTADTATAPHGGETVVDLIARVGRWLEAIERLSGRSVAFAPASVLKAGLVNALGAPASSFARIDIKPMRTAVFVSDGRRWNMRSFGRRWSGS